VIGQSIAHYRVTAKIGAGGMGEVYQAVDTRLGRNVAIKVLPSVWMTDADRMRRFEREAQVLASLNHPRIAAIYGMERAEPTAGNREPLCALVMELVEGATLADRIATGPLAVDEALPIAAQIADALEYAHDRGIVHRDLKPANIKLTTSGEVKVLDFGLAKAMTDPASAFAAADSPTFIGTATLAGVVMGTAAYMAPEQAKGLPVDRRADIWAFGAVVYEMLTGTRAYGGDAVTDILASVVRDEPKWSALPDGTPPRVRALLARCEVKDVRRRLQAIGEARITLEDVIAHADRDDTTAVGEIQRDSRWTRVLPWALTALLAIVAALAWLPRNQTARSEHALRLSFEVSPAASVVPQLGPAVVLSPDGTMVAFRGRARATEKPQIFVRRLSQVDAVPLAGTDDADEIFFSRDGQWIGFSAERKLKKVPVVGGDVVTLADAPLFRGGDWTDDAHIVFAPSSRGGLFRISDEGGQPEPLTSLNKATGEITHRNPQVLPGNVAVLYTAHSNSVTFDDATIMVQPLSGAMPKRILQGGYAARYVTSGHLAYLHDESLFVVPFDLQRLETTGTPSRVIDHIANIAGSAGAQFSVSSSGALIYLTGGQSTNSVPLVWLDAKGKTQPMRAPGLYLAPRFSPDGRRLAVQVFAQGGSKIWIYDWQRDVMSRLTDEMGDERDPLWSPDGQRIVFSSDREEAGKSHLYVKRLDSTERSEQLTDIMRSERESPGSWLPDGKTVAVAAINPKSNGWDIIAVQVDRDSGSNAARPEPKTILSASYGHFTPVISPDGKWLAYESLETGRREVHVRRFPELDHKEQISLTGGTVPIWSRTHNELFYRSGEGIMAVSYAPSGAEFNASKPRVWNREPLASLDGVRNLDLHPDGTRMVIVRAADTLEGVARDKAVLVLNFAAELRRIAPSTR